jgi:hypothetical protein
MMWGINPSIVLILIPIVFVGIIAIAAVGSLDEKTRGERISRFFSIASNAAIFFTVLALLYQVTDSEEESRRAAYSELLTTYYDINQMQFEHPEAWRIMYPSENESTLSEDEMIAVTNSYFIMNFFERIYLMYRDGDIEEERWKMWENWIRYSLTSSPLFQHEWDESCGLHHTDFVTYVETTYDDGICGGPDDHNAAPSASPTAKSYG